MKALRTPDHRFNNLPGYSFSPNFVEVSGSKGSDSEASGLRMHYLDEGDKGSDAVLLMHGEPSWSYLYRKMIPIIVDAGYRAVAPDLIGFGKSDKPALRTDYTYARHVAWMEDFLEKTALKNIHLVCQDWGGLIGLRLVAEKEALFKSVVAANTGLPTGDHAPSEAFLAWQKFSQETPELPVGQILKSGLFNDVGEDILRAYDAPFPDESYKEGARIFPALVPTRPDDPASEANRRAWNVLSKFEKPFLTLFSDNDPITKGGEKVFQKIIPGTRSQPHATIKNAGHFLQEDAGEEFADLIVQFLNKI
jgi:haloalkane dehalogenase